MHTNIDEIVKIIYNRGTATYKHGKLDFSKGEGGNNHIYAYDDKGNEIGYMWFDTHCEYTGFCGKSSGSCRGVFRDAIMKHYPRTWEKDDSLFQFTDASLKIIMNEVIDRIR